ncbi:MAG: shikimate dehydrogenase [Rhizobiaceae bacterium]
MADRPRAFVCGHPVAHSRSPLIHGHWLSVLGIDGTYEAVDVLPGDFPDFLRNLRHNGYVGGNVTIPHKEAAFQLVDETDEAARHIGAVNTLWIEDGRLLGMNTDWLGFAANLDEWTSGWDYAKTATVLGAGGAARGVLYALVHRGFDEIRIVNRTVSRAETLADEFGSLGGTRFTAHGWNVVGEALSGAELLVNTTSLGMDETGAEPLDLSPLAPDAVVNDIVYMPLETPLLTAARAKGFKTVDGLGMLLHQAVAGFEKWFGATPLVTGELRRLVVEDMERKK